MITLLGGGAIFDNRSYQCTGITPINNTAIAFTTATLINSQISSGIIWKAFSLNPYYPWLWGGFGNIGKDFYKWQYISRGIDAQAWNVLKIGTFSTPVILGNFSFTSQEVASYEVFSFLFLSDIISDKFTILFGANSYQDSSVIVINKSDLNILNNATVESIFTRIFLRYPLLLNNNPSIQYQGKFFDDGLIIYSYWMQIYESISLDNDENINPFSPTDLGGL